MHVAQPSRSVALAMVLLIATLLAARPMGLGLDDENYLEYFNGAQEILSRYEGLSYVFNEPLWLLLCYSANALLGDEGALRFVIFASSAFAGVGVARMNRWSLLPITGLAGDMEAIRRELNDQQWHQLQNPVPCELAAGEAVFHHPLTVHGSRANRTAIPRRAVVVNVVADGTRSDSDEPLLAGVPPVPRGAPLDGQFFPLLFDPAEIG